MMRFSSVLLAVGLLAAVPAPAQTPEEAREAENGGRWTEALQQWEALAGTRTPGAGEAYIQALEAVGDYEALDREAEALLRNQPGLEPVVRAQARSRGARGRPEEGLALLEALPVRSPLGEVDRARLLDQAGRHEEAKAVMEGLLEGPSARPADRLALGHAARRLGHYEQASRLYQLTYRDSLEYLEPRLSLAVLFQEKYQTELAAEELNEAEALAPDHPDLHRARAVVARAAGRLSEAERSARKLLTIRPGDPEGRGVLAYLSLIAEAPEDAANWVRPVLEQNPRDLERRSLLAAAYYFEGDSTAYHTEVERIFAQEPEYLDFYFDLGRLLEMHRRYEETFAFYEKVLTRDPENPAALIAKGLLLMKEGREAEARIALETGFEGDPFNIRAYNQLTLLDRMDTFTSYESDHFSIRLDAAEDSVFAPMLEESLESIFRELTPRHGWTPEGKTVVEVIPTHELFSARVTGMPWLSGIPAVCFGDVVAMDSPRTLGGRMNWIDILRHEYGHVLALGMSGKKVPFWFTEGLSVHLEHFPREQSWDENLKAALVDGRLVSVDSLTIAFTRPRYQTDRLMAYHESSLIIDDIVERKGWDVIPQMLRAFGEGRTFRETVQSVLREDPDTFNREVLDRIRKHAAALPVWPAPDRARMTRLDEESVRRDDTPFLELFLVTQFQFGFPNEAAITAEQILDREPDHPGAIGILGLIDVQAKRMAEAAPKLERAAALGSRDIPVYLALADLALAARDTAAAIGHYGDLLGFYPNSREALHTRARLRAATGDRKGALADYRLLLERNASAGEAALELARLELEEADAPAAARTLEYARAIFATHPDVEALEGRAFLLEGRDRLAYERFLAAKRLDIKNVEAMVGLALYYLEQEDYEEAVYFAELALRYAPDQPVALRVLAEARAN